MTTETWTRVHTNLKIYLLNPETEKAEAVILPALTTALGTEDDARMMLALTEKELSANRLEAEQPGSGSEADRTLRKPSHEAIDLSTADPDALGLDPLDDNDVKLINAIEIAHYKRQIAATALPELPALLKHIPNWVQWKLENINGRPSKVPYVAGTNRHASSTDSTTWTDFQTAINDVTPTEKFGVGFVIHGVATEQQIIGFDLDGCRNPETGELTSWADEIIDGLDSYTEVTPSQTGVRVWVRGILPGKDHVFNLDPAIGVGTKVKIEVFTSGRYFTVTGDALFEGLGVEARDLTKVYELCHEIRRKHPAKASTPKAEAGSSAVSSGPVRVVTEPGSFSVDKLTLLMTGTIQSTQPFVIEDERGNSLEYPSHSEADLALATCLAINHGDNPEIISAEFRKSPLFGSERRDKWERLEEQTIQKAIKSAKEIAGKSDQMIIPAVSVSSTAPERFLTDVIPEFDRSCVTGIYKKVVDLVCEGTTIPPQFAFLAAKVFIGARMAGKVTFENLDADSSYYGTVIAETGTGKGLAWRRTVEGVFQTANILENGVKIIYSADSGAGLKDTFFEPPEDQPVICYIDEVTSLGHKAGEKKNPEIIDTIIELADSNRISRVLASRKGQKANRTSNARLSLYVCGQNGDVFMSSFAGRTKLGIYDRLYPEYSAPVEAGDLPEVDQARARELWTELNRMKMSGHMIMAEDTKSRLDAFWKSQPTEVKKKPRFKKHLMLDMYMAAFGRGVMIAEPEDLESAINLFSRQIVIRTVHFTTEVPDRVGLYISRLKAIFHDMRRRLNAGEIIAQVAMSERDFQTDTLAYKENDLQSFNTAWRNFAAHVAKTAVIGKNGHTYQKFIPEPNEDEVWVP